MHLFMFVRRTDNAIKNHWNSTMRRKFELDEEMRTLLQTTSDGTLIGYPVAVAYPEPLPSPLPPGLPKLEPISTGSTGYWPGVASRDALANTAGQKSGVDLPLPDFSEWLSSAPYPSPGPTISHAPVYAPFEPIVTNSMSFRPSPNTASSLYSFVPSEPRSRSPVIPSSVKREQPQMIIPSPLFHHVHPSGVDHGASSQHPKQASPLLLHQQHQPQMFAQSTACNSAVLQPAQSTAEASFLPHPMMTDYHQCNPAAVSFSVLFCFYISEHCK